MCPLKPGGRGVGEILKQNYYWATLQNGLVTISLMFSKVGGEGVGGGGGRGKV